MCIYVFNSGIGVITKFNQDSEYFNSLNTGIVVSEHPNYYLKLEDSTDEVAINKFRHYFQNEIAKSINDMKHISNNDTSSESYNVYEFNEKLSLYRLGSILTAIPTKVV